MASDPVAPYAERDAEQHGRARDRRKQQVLECSFRCRTATGAVHDQRERGEREHLDAHEKQDEAGAVHDDERTEQGRARQEGRLVRASRKHERPQQAARKDDELSEQREAVDADLARQRLGGVACCDLLPAARRSRRATQA